MLRHLLPSYKRLLREGKQARGLILEVREPRVTWTLGRFNFKLRMRALLPDGSRPEFDAVADTHELNGEFAHAGDEWPIRFDPADRGRIDVDLPALRAEILAERERVETTHLRLAEERLGEGPQP